MISNHNCLLIARVRFHKLNYINSHMVKGTLHWYRHKWMLYSLARLTGCTHQATLTLPRNISPHPRPPIMFWQFSMHLSSLKWTQNFPLCVSSNRCVQLPVGGIRYKVLSASTYYTIPSMSYCALLNNNSVVFYYHEVALPPFENQ